MYSLFLRLNDFKDEVVGNGYKWGCEEEEYGVGFRCLLPIGQPWRHFPPRAPPPSFIHPALLFALIPLPPSVPASLPLWLSSRRLHHNWSISCNISSQNLREENSVFLYSFFFFIFTIYGCLHGAPSLYQFHVFSPLYFLLFCLSFFLLSVGRIFIFRTCCFCLPPRPLQRSHLC